jgi:hypothetical protein
MTHPTDSLAGPMSRLALSTTQSGELVHSQRDPTVKQYCSTICENPAVRHQVFSYIALLVLSDQSSSLNSDEGENVGAPLHQPAIGIHRPPPPVYDDSGDPEGHYFIPRPPDNLIGPRWVVWCGLWPGIYDSW